jgi:predicted SAM-dependent methyltransferase
MQTQPFELESFLSCSSVVRRQKYPVYRLALFELNSLIGRTFFNKRPRLLGKDVKLNLGAGGKPSGTADWINADFFPSIVTVNPLALTRNILDYVSRRHAADWQLDLRFPLNCADGTWAGVFTSHTLEHLHYDNAFRLLKEIHRTLKPQSWVRIVLPDLGKYIQYYNHSSSISQFSRYNFGAQAVHGLTQNWEHLSVWDYELLREMLQAAGFANVAQVAYRSGSDSTLFLDLEGRDWESFYAEAQKT